MFHHSLLDLQVPMNAKQFKPVGTDDTNKLSVSNGEGYSGIWDWKPDTCLTIDGYPAKPTGLPTLHLSQEHGFIAVASGRNTMDIKVRSTRHVSETIKTLY